VKQIDLTADLQAKIQTAVGEDVDPSGFAVFEAIALNSSPLPGKRGTLFEGAVATPLTIVQMAQSINGGKHIPLMADHNMSGQPYGRVFEAGVDFANDGASELRILFYVDGTEPKLIAKINAGSLDEVSVQFLASQLLCSECEFDYLGDTAISENVWTRTCDNGHVIGTDGVHIRMVGLNQFMETSLVATGASKNPKIVGRSQSKLSPTTSMRLAARGFEVDALVFQGSRGEEQSTVDLKELNAALIDEKVKVITLSGERDAGTKVITTLTAERDALAGQVTSLTAELATATAAVAAAPDATAVVEGTAALAFLGEIYSKVLVAAKQEVPAELPKTVAELKAGIEEHTAKLTAILPIGGVAVGVSADDDTNTAEKDYSSFQTRR
jgi:hypothetical protein